MKCLNSHNNVLYREAKQRFDWLDIAKGIGIIAVVLSHSNCSNLIWLVSACYVPVFFVCSGYTLKNKDNQSFIVFVVQKCRRLLLPYLFCMTLIVAFNFVVGCFLHQPFDSFRSTIGALYSRAELFHHGTVNNILMLPMNSQPMWFLTALLLTLIVAYPLLKWKINKEVVPLIVLSLLLIEYFFTKLPILLPWSMDCLPAFLFMVFWGYLVREREWMKLPMRHYSVILAIYVVILFFTGTVNFSVRQFGNSVILAIVSSLFGSLLLLKLSQLIEKFEMLRRPLVALGRHSLYVMCFHLPVLTVCAKIIPILTGCEEIQYMFSLMSVALALVVGVFFSIKIQQCVTFL